VKWSSSLQKARAQLSPTSHHQKQMYDSCCSGNPGRKKKALRTTQRGTKANSPSEQRRTESESRPRERRLRFGGCYGNRAGNLAVGETTESQRVFSTAHAPRRKNRVESPTMSHAETLISELVQWQQQENTGAQTRGTEPVVVNCDHESKNSGK
jgi:hypothetical protein